MYRLLEHCRPLPELSGISSFVTHARISLLMTKWNADLLGDISYLHLKQIQ
jgi:hypothetical protein